MDYPTTKPLGLMTFKPSEMVKPGDELIDGGERVTVLANYGILDAPGHPQDGRMRLEVEKSFTGYQYMTGVPVGTVPIFTN
jgi:hypothetical protein